MRERWSHHKYRIAAEVSHSQLNRVCLTRLDPLRDAIQYMRWSLQDELPCRVPQYQVILLSQLPRLRRGTRQLTSISQTVFQKLVTISVCSRLR